MRSVTQAMYDYIRWEWDDEKHCYVKTQSGDADGPRCGECGAEIDQEYADALGY
jgi:hypothetical protein